MSYQDLGPPDLFPLHDLYHHNTYKGVIMPPFCSEKRYKQIEEEFVPGPGDVLIATYQKSGTTWLQNVVYRLLDCPNGPIEKLNIQVPWIQAGEPSWEVVQNMKSPRVFKSHDRWDWTPDILKHSDTLKTIYCYRNPKDIVVSYFHHTKLLVGLYGGKIADMDFHEFFRDVARKHSEFGMWEDHVVSYLEQKDRENLLILTYEDLIEDLEREVRKIVAFLGLEVSEERIQEVVEAGTFNNMQKDNTVNYTWIAKDEEGGKRFMRKGKVGTWQGYYTAEEEAILEQAGAKVSAAGGSVRYQL